MNTNIWYYMEQYPYETVAIIIICIVAYFGYIELSKFWHKPLYIYGDGWRIKRCIGRIISIKGEKKFYSKTSEIEDFEAIIKMSGQPRRKIMLPRDALDYTLPNKIVMKKKYIKWNKNDNTYILSDIKIDGYLLDMENIQRLDYNKIDQIDQKATRSARASPKLIHTVFSMHNIPLDDYEPEDDLVIKTGKDVYDIDSAGGYGSFKALEEKYKKESEEREKEQRERLGIDGENDKDNLHDIETGGY